MSKCIEEIKLHLPEELKRDIQDLSMLDDRKVSEWIRHELTAIVHLRKHGVIVSDCLAKARGE